MNRNLTFLYTTIPSVFDAHRHRIFPKGRNLLNTKPKLRQICFLVNSRSGGGQGKALLEQLKKLLGQNSFERHAFPIEDISPKDVSYILQQYELVILAGGDGTIARLLPQLLDSNIKVGVIPLGTGNDLARQLGVHGKVSYRDAASAVDKFTNAKTHPLSVWEAQFGNQESIIFCNYLSFGFDAKVISTFAEMRERLSWVSQLAGRNGNRLLYTVAAIQCWKSRIPADSRIRASFDGKQEQPIKGTLKSLLFSNVAAIMGLGWTSGKSDPFDDQLELNVITSPFDYARMMTPLRLSARKHHIEPFHTITLRGLPRNIPIQSDGEDRGFIDTDSVSITKRGSVNLCVLSE